jgi:hypothetical protein
MMDRAKPVTANETAPSEVLEREVTRLFEDVHLDPETLDLDEFRSVGTLADYLDAQQMDSALAAEPSQA